MQHLNFREHKYITLFISYFIEDTELELQLAYYHEKVWNFKNKLEVANIFVFGCVPIARYLILRKDSI